LDAPQGQAIAWLLDAARPPTPNCLSFALYATLRRVCRQRGEMHPFRRVPSILRRLRNTSFMALGSAKWYNASIGNRSRDHENAPRDESPSGGRHRRSVFDAPQVYTP